MAAKYFVYGDGRWRELDLSTGCVSGWGRVQWVSLQFGRLQAARRRRVLQALAALAAGRPTRARNGPRLPVYRELEESKPETEHRLQKHQQSINSCNHCCCRHEHGCNKAEAHRKPVTVPQPALNVTVDAATQADPFTFIKNITQVEIPRNHSIKRKHSDTSSDSSELPAQPNRKIQGESYKSVRRHSDDSSDLLTISHKKQTDQLTKELVISQEDVSLLRACLAKNIVFPEADLRQFDTNDEYKTLIFYKLNPLVNVVRSTQIKRMLQKDTASSVDDNVTIDEFASQLGLQSVKDIKQTQRYKTRNNIVQSAKKKDFTVKPLSNGQINYKKSSKSSSSSDNINLSQNRKPNHSRPNKRKSNQLASSESSIETDKENYNLNKNRTRNAKTTLHEALRRYSKNNGQFRSIAKETLSNDSNETKSNSPANKKRKLWSNDASEGPKLRDRSIVISDGDSDEGRVDNSNGERRESKRLSSAKKPAEPEKQTGELNKEEPAKNKVGLFFKKRSGAPMTKVIASKIVLRPRPSLTKSFVPREYSPAEDAAIVRWMRGEPGRARRVKGNQLWRQLETEYLALTGRARTWHSLRNRYLRGILPSLHMLPLSARDAAALRAAAAQGEMGTRDAVRHPLFPAPRAGAASRLPAASKPPPASPPRLTRRSLRDASTNQATAQPTAQSTSEPKSAPKQKDQDTSPTYSDITRRFALRLRSTPSLTPKTTNSKEDTPNKSVKNEKEAAGKSKSRRLYNP